MTLVIILIVPLIMGLFAMLFPYRQPIGMGHLGLSYLKKRYQKWEIFAVFIFILFIPLMAYAYSRLFLTIYNALSTKEAGTVFKVVPNELLWLAPGSLLAFATVAFPVMLLYRFLLGESYDEYLCYTNMKHGFDGQKILKPLSWILGILAAMVLLLLSDYTIEVKQDKVIKDEFFSLSAKQYTYHQIDKVYYIEPKVLKDSNAIAEPYHVVLFSDNSIWDTRDGLIDDTAQARIINHISLKAAKVIDTIHYHPKNN